MASTKKKKDVQVDSGAIPASEERVYLYSKSGAERIAELEEKRRAYKSLDVELETLPRKLKHKGLVPLGPGLYAQGSLVRTNEVLVLLGESYFAERSAYQAREIVQRRLKVIESKIAEVDVGKNEVAAAFGESAVQGRKPNGEVELPLPVLKESGKANENCTSNKGLHPATGSEVCRKVSNKRPPRSPAGKESVGDASTPRSNTSKTKRVSFSGSAKKESVESSFESCLGQASGKKIPSDAIQDLLANFGKSVDQAEQISKETGVVHLMEEYDTDGNLKTANVPEKSGLENAGGTLEDANEGLFDMTEPEKPISELGQEDYLKMLIEAEREEELNQQREETKRVERARKKDMKDFGKGFAKGFFDKKEKGDDKTNKEPKSILRNSNDRPPVDAEALREAEHFDVDPEVEAVDVHVERQAVRSNIVERGLGTRRRRHKATPAKKCRPTVLDLHAVEEANVEPEIAVAPIEEEESPVPRMSKFKQMRALQQRER